MQKSRAPEELPEEEQLQRAMQESIAGMAGVAEAPALQMDGRTAGAPQLNSTKMPALPMGGRAAAVRQRDGALGPPTADPYHGLVKRVAAPVGWPFSPAPGIPFPVEKGRKKSGGERIHERIRSKNAKRMRLKKKRSEMTEDKRKDKNGEASQCEVKRARS